MKLHHRESVFCVCQPNRLIDHHLYRSDSQMAYRQTTKTERKSFFLSCSLNLSSRCEMNSQTYPFSAFSLYISRPVWEWRLLGCIATTFSELRRRQTRSEKFNCDMMRAMGQQEGHSRKYFLLKARSLRVFLSILGFFRDRPWLSHPTKQWAHSFEFLLYLFAHHARPRPAESSAIVSTVSLLMILLGWLFFHSLGDEGKGIGWDDVLPQHRTRDTNVH